MRFQTIIHIAIATCLVIAGSVTGAESRTDPVVSSLGDVIAFSRHCADEKPYRVQAYALLEASSTQARALVQVQAGFSGVEQFISIVVGLEALALNAGADWGNRTFSLRLVLEPVAGTTVEGPALSTWYDADEWSPPAEPPMRRFTTTAKGQTRWLTFVEPGEEATEFDHDGHHVMEPMRIAVRDLALQDRYAPIALAIIIRDLANAEEIRMAGPSFLIPARIWTMQPPPPTAKALNLPQALNPMQEGGIANTVVRQWTYRGCIKERRQAKKMMQR